jgi:hypothetical protein
MKFSVMWHRMGLTLFFARGFLSTLKMEATRFSDTLVLTRATRRHIPENGIPKVTV